jgi:hypothetical protein
MKRTYTTQKQLRRAFREQFPGLDFRTIPSCSGKGRMHKTDTRCAFADWIDSLSKNGDISQELAQRVTL